MVTEGQNPVFTQSVNPAIVQYPALTGRYACYEGGNFNPYGIDLNALAVNGGYPRMATQETGGYKITSPQVHSPDRCLQLYAEAILRGPKLEIQVFGEQPLSWLRHCEKFFAATGTPQTRWVNLATAHLVGRAENWFSGLGVPWRYITWAQFCRMVIDRFSEMGSHEAVARFQILQQVGSVPAYIDEFEECMAYLRRDHPYLQEAFF
uniref:Retrotransposon gag domain-containing protein n=1 Tax=Arundo donax TaxID=35708 RepID=A0A0A8ZX52_ARUDO